MGNVLESYYKYEQSNSCEAAFANNILWSPFYEMEYAIVAEAPQKGTLLRISSCR